MSHIWRLRWATASGSLVLLAVLGSAVPAAHAQAASAPAASSTSKQAGTVKSASGDTVVLTSGTGQDVNVAISGTTKVLIVPPGSTNLSTATAGAVSDIQPGDRALVTGSAGDAGAAFHAARVIVMKSGAIAQAHAAEASAWAQGSGGIVKSVSAGTVVISSGLKTVSVTTTPTTIVRRYAPGSVKFEDAVGSSVAAIQPGDQLRVRGHKSEDGLSITADEIVTGAFANFSGTLATVDSTANAVTLKDLASKKTVSVSLTANSDVRRLPPQMAAAIAGRMRGASGAAAAGKPASGAPSASSSPSAPSSEGTAEGGQQRANAAGGDLSRMLSRLPAETISGLKPGDAVMIVASPSANNPQTATAITLLVGVEPILAAPSGASTTLSPWNMGGQGEAPGMGGATQ